MNHVPQYPFSENELLQTEVFWVSLVGIWLLYSLLAAWMATRDWHWFLRFGLLAAAVSVLRFIEADDLMLMQLANCMTVFTLLVGWRMFRKWKTEPEHWREWRKRLSLANLLLAVASLAILLSIISVDLKDLVPRSDSIGFGCAVGLAFMIGAGVMSIRNRWVTIAAVLVAMIGVYFAYYWIFPEPKKTSFLAAFRAAIIGTSFIWGELASFARAILVAMAVAGLIVGYIHRRNRQTNRFARILLRCGSGLAVLVAALLAFSILDVGFRLAYRFPPRSVQPTQEGQFGKLARIGNRFAASTVFTGYQPADEAALRKELLSYVDDFNAVKAVLDIPDPDTSLQAGFSNEDLYEQIHGIRMIARSFADKARLNFADGNPDYSLADSVIIVSLREPFSREGFISIELSGMAIERMGHICIVESTPHASKQAIAKALENVLELDARPYDFQLICENDEAVEWESNNWYRRLCSLCRYYGNESYEFTGMRVIAARQQVIAMLALELHHRDKNGYPQSLESLVPHYLDRVPRDPFGGDAPLRYEAIDGGKDYLLYSVGFNHDDDGGKLDESGYGTPNDEASDLNFKEAARLDLIERDEELAERDSAVAEE